MDDDEDDMLIEDIGVVTEPEDDDDEEEEEEEDDFYEEEEIDEDDFDEDVEDVEIPDAPRAEEGVFGGVDMIMPRRSFKGARNIETVKDCTWALSLHSAGTISCSFWKYGSDH